MRDTVAVIRIALKASMLTLVSVGASRAEAGQPLTVGIIDFYGLGRISERAAREALTLKEGDEISVEGEGPRRVLAELARRVSALPGVDGVKTELVCCESGRAILYVGVAEHGRAVPSFREPPRGTEKLPPDVVEAGRAFERASMVAIRAGQLGEDTSQGHSLFHDAATREIQQRFVGLAARHVESLRRVLRNSGDGDSRALAAQILGYVADKQTVVDDLVYAMGDPVPEIRNNAMRALALFAGLDPSAGHPGIRVPAKPFLALLHSQVWTDRNKASLAVDALTTRRDPALLESLRRGAAGPLVEMARWKSMGHATAALVILGRIGGLSEAAIAVALDGGDRDALIEAALARSGPAVR